MRQLALMSFIVSSVLWASTTRVAVGVNESVYVDGITTRLEQIATPQEFFDQLDEVAQPSSDEPEEALPGSGVIKELSVILDQIINMGEKMWKFIADRKPVVTVKRAYANALPKGVRSSEDLDGFSSLNHTSYRLYGTNGFGMTVYDITYTLIHRHNGNYEGKGAYVDNATVLPQTVEAMWGYSVDASVEGINVVNVGTKENPVGSVIMETCFKVSTIVKAAEYRSVFEFRGDSPRTINVNYH